MISPELRNVASFFASTHRRYPDALPDVLPFFAGIVLITHRELIAHPLNTEPDWPWQKPTPKQLSKDGYDLLYFEPKGDLYVDGNGDSKGFGKKSEGGMIADLPNDTILTESDVLIGV